MRNKQWNEPRDNWDPWDQGTYQTGSTQPPKSHGGLIAVLLCIVILLGGAVSLLGLLNIRLFQQINDQPDSETLSISFYNSTEPSSSIEATADASVPADSQESVTIHLNESPEGVANIPQEGGLSLQDIYSRTIDCVVSISCSFPAGSSSGTGVVLTPNGYLVTNAHVVEGAQTIRVQFNDGRVMEASLVGADGVSDLAVLRVTAEELKAAELGDSGSLQVGDTVVAIGDPLGAQLHGTMTDGIVSAINRNIEIDGRTMTLIQTNAALNAGNSGGPLINCYGQVIGINTMKIGDYMSSSAGVEGLGFAIPTTTVKDVVDQLIRQGYVSGRPAIGLEGESLSRLYQMYYGVPEGLYVTEVAESGSADAAGIKTGDILISLDGTRITSQEALNTVLYAHQAGDTLTALIYRHGRQYSVTITLGEARS